MLQSKTLWHLSNTKSALKVDELNTDDKVLIKSLYSLISIGTERLVSNGKVPTNLYEPMKVPYMAGAFSFPVKYGYSLVGEVQSEHHELFGQRVHIMHPHQDLCAADEKDLFVIPPELDAKTATLASNLETALNAIWDSKVSIGDKVLIVGFGLIGSLVARLVSLMPGTEVVIAEINPSKVALAKKLGFRVEQEESTYDLAFHCSASTNGLQACIEKVGFEGKIIELSWYGDQLSPIHLGGTFHYQRKQLISSQVSNLPLDRRGSWTYKKRKETVFNLLKNPIFKHHITQTIKFASSPDFFALIRNNEAHDLGICIDYKDGNDISL